MSRGLGGILPAAASILLAVSIGPISAQDASMVIEVVHRDVNKELVRVDAGLLRKLFGLVGNDPVLRQQVTEELSDAVRSLDGNAAAVEELVENLGKLRSKDEVVKLASGKRLRAYAASLAETHAARFAGKGDDLLRTIVGQGDGAVDEAGAEALRLLREVQDDIARAGKVDPALGQRLAAVVRKLPPERARAARQLVRNELAAKGGGLFNIFQRTGVDGLFVLYDAYALSGAQQGSQTAADATGKAVGYGLDVVGNVAVRALGGGAFLHTLVVSLSTAAVAELVTQVIMLQYDRENAAMQQQWADMELRMDVIRGMLRVDELIKQGKYGKAQVLIAKVRQFYFSRPELATGGDDLFNKIQDLEQKAIRAAHLVRANAIIAEARIAYMQGYRLARQGRLLGLARNHVDDAERILQESLGVYPELQAALNQTRALLAAIDRIRANPPPLGKPGVGGPDRVAAGEVIGFEIALQGGIPDYQPIGLAGVALPTGALVFWEAPMQAGPATFSVQLRDDSGRVVEARKRVDVVVAEPVPASTDLRLRGYTIRPGYRQDGRIVPPQQIEAHRVHTWDDVYFEASLQQKGLRYQWSVNGKLDPSPHSGHTYLFQPQAEGAYTVELRVHDAKGQLLGTARWTLQALDMVVDQYIVDPRIPPGDE